MEQIGAWLKDARERHGAYSQEQAAARVDSTARTVGAWERGETAPPVDKFFALVVLYDAAPRLRELLPRQAPPAKVAPLIPTSEPAARKRGRGAAG